VTTGGENTKPTANGHKCGPNGEGKHPLEYAIFFLVVITAVATGFAAYYTHNQWITAEDTAKRQLRAYVFFRPHGHFKLPEVGAPMEIPVPIRNYGPTPAYKPVIYIGGRLWDVSG
jgi:hypothetical protein